jgi:hypothetical protein
MMTKQFLGEYKVREVKTEYQIIQDRLKTDPVLINISENIAKMRSLGKLEQFDLHYNAFISKALIGIHSLISREIVWLRGYVNYRIGQNISFEIKKSGFETYRWTITTLEDGKTIATKKFKDNETNRQKLSDEFKCYKYYFLSGKNDDVCCLFTESKIATRSYKFNWVLNKPEGAL